MKILAFGASNSTQSVNQKLARYTASLKRGAQVTTLDLNDFELPIFSIEREANDGHPKLAHDFIDEIGKADAVIVSYAEHNANYTVAYKNLFDWASRINRQVFQQKPVIFLATSPGPNGGARVLNMACGSAEVFGADLKAQLSVPSFFENYNLESDEIINPQIKQQLLNAVNSL